MSGGRKLWVSLLGIACVMVLALCSRGLDSQVIQSAITALLVIVPGYGLSNVGATFAHATSKSSVEQVSREIVERRDGDTEATP